MQKGETLTTEHLIQQNNSKQNFDDEENVQAKAEKLLQQAVERSIEK